MSLLRLFRKESAARAASILWYLLPSAERRRIADRLTSAELEELNRLYADYRRDHRRARLASEQLLADLLRPGRRDGPALAATLLAALFLFLLLLHSVIEPDFGVAPRLYLFTPLAIGVLAPLSLWMLPPWQQPLLWRIGSPRGESLFLLLFAFLGTLWLMTLIRIEASPLTGRLGGLTLLIFAIGALTAPLVEEVIFRELMVRPFGGLWPLGHFVAAVLFAAAHLPESLMMGGLYCGAALFLSVARLVSGTLFWPWLIHAVVNLVTLLFF